MNQPPSSASRFRLLMGSLLVLSLSCPSAWGQGSSPRNATTPGEVTTPYPTLHQLAVEWEIDGDDNLNGVVTTQYRAVGETTWREAMPLSRVAAKKRYFEHEKVPHAWKNKHSGSLFHLEPDTQYEIKLTLNDPDGGTAEKVVTARTRPVPGPAPNALQRKVTPETIGTAKPGEILLLAAGNYGEFHAPRDGEPGKPIVYRSEKGDAVFKTILLVNRKHVHLDGLTIKNEDKHGKGVNLVGAVDCVVQHCKVNAMYAICAPVPPGATSCYIADNIVEGTTPWTAESMGAHGDNIGEGIQLTGPGNVICYNRVTGYRDCISTMEGRIADQSCIDIYNNDIYTGADDGIEADFCHHNCRIMRNRMTNCFVALSSQPGLGGPNYFIRNVAYNITHAAFKLKRDSVGDVVIHNTVIKLGTGLGGNSPMEHAYFRNNLCIGGPVGDNQWGGYGGGAPAAADIRSPGERSSFDYDAVGVYKEPFWAKIDGKPFAEVEPHGIQIDMSVFNKVEFPYPPLPGRPAPDLRPRAASAVVDAGVRLPNINDDYLGDAPDIGAYEAGRDLPHYGPRLRGEN
ncbi:right-handed parallel beta-helix repeat-containing protein [Adhaeretor mobilis]|uniref:Right handed beta helix domain-containing protein n=1 Tax=Adhaeretor mobilis TaxID=1930276 RepID=A0A517MPU9_9BACT|nr:right-handed parallel beta-helix repeat-containing protein [Adhaeretor mobilis]QDS96913.1 hypothetical protein HG15A2_01720 [Adhaeretor mobilis]